MSAAKEVIGSTIHNTVEMPLTATEGLRTSSVVRGPAEPVIAAVPAEREPVQEPGEAVLQAVELELARVEAEPERDHPRGQLVVARERTRSATAPHRRGQRRPLTGAQASAAAAGTTPAQAATEAATAWAVVG